MKSFARKDFEEHNLRQRRYFERAEKRNMLPSGTPYLRRHVEELVRFARLSPDERVLEVGCGMGRYTLLLAERGLRVEGLDLSPVLLERLRSFDAGRFQIPLHCADIWEAPMELRERFDAVVGFFALHHLHDLARCFASMARLVRPGGRIVFLEPNAYNPLYYLQMALKPGMTWEGDKGIVRMRRSIVERAATDAGLVGFAVERFGFFPPFLANRAAGASLEAALERIPFFSPFLPFQLFRCERA